MLAKVSVPFPLFRIPTDVLPADVAHRIPTDTGELVAAGSFDEACPAARTGAFDGCCSGGFDRGAEGHEERFVADVRVVPGFFACEA